MRSSTWRLDDLRNVTLNLGFVGENLHTRQIIDCKKMFDQYPQASVSMTVTPPEGEPYPGQIERDGDLVIWDVRDCDLAAEGDGEIQIVFTQEPHIARSINVRTHICRSQQSTGSVPSGYEDFITRADQLLDQVEETFPAGGTTGQVLAKKSDEDYDTEWVDQSGGGGGTSDYEELENLPQIGGVTLKGNKSLHDLGAATEEAVSAKYTKPESGIPAGDMADGVIPVLTDLIDDTAGDGDTDKVWSADKSSELLSQINTLRPDATNSDVGKYLKVKTVADGKVSEYEFGSGGGGGGGSDIDDTAGAGDTDKAWSADKLTTKFGVIENLQTAVETGLLTGFAQGGVNQNNGVIDTTNTEACYVGPIPMKAGDKYTFSRAVNTIQLTTSLAIYNTSGTYVSGRGVTNGTTITFENDGYFAIGCALNGNVSATMAQAIESANASFTATFDKTIKVVETVNKHETEISTIHSDISKMKGFRMTKDDLKTGIYYKVSSGTVSEQTDSTAKYCPKIDVSAFRGMKMRIWMNTVRSGSSRALGFCDAENNVGNYLTETGFSNVADGGYYNVIIVDKDYMFFSCSGDQTTIRIEIVDGDSFVTRSLLDGTLYNGKYYHMSFDDVIACLQDITTNALTYESIFENDLFGWCKQMHDLYGTTFSLFVFYQNASSDPTWTLADCTNAFASEFTANADWLRFGFHAYYQNTNATSREATAATDYSNVIAQLIRITGSAKCIDRMPRLHEYNGTLTALTSMRDCEVGPVGFIASADTNMTTPRDSYYFDSDQNAYMYKHAYMYDAENFLHFVKTSYMWISSSVSITDRENGMDYYNRNRFTEIFLHENSVTSGNKSSFEGKFRALSYSHKPCFMMDLVLTN